jgi:hypothetical protein
MDDGYCACEIKEENFSSVLRCSLIVYSKKRVRAKIPLPTNLLSGVGGESNPLYLLLFSSYLSSSLISSI